MYKFMCIPCLIQLLSLSSLIYNGPVRDTLPHKASLLNKATCCIIYLNIVSPICTTGGTTITPTHFTSIKCNVCWFV